MAQKHHHRYLDLLHLESLLEQVAAKRLETQAEIQMLQIVLLEISRFDLFSSQQGSTVHLV